MTRVAPLSSVKSVTAHIVLHCTAKPVGKGKKSKAHWSRCTIWAGSSGPMAMSWVRWSCTAVASDMWARAAPSTSGSVISRRAVAERAMRPPVRRVRRPLKSSGPKAVASRAGSSSSRKASMTSVSTSRSTTTQPTASSCVATSPGVAVAGRCGTLTAQRYAHRRWPPIAPVGGRYRRPRHARRSRHRGNVHRRGDRRRQPRQGAIEPVRSVVGGRGRSGTVRSVLPRPRHHRRHQRTARASRARPSRS